MMKSILLAIIGLWLITTSARGMELLGTQSEEDHLGSANNESISAECKKQTKSELTELDFRFKRFNGTGREFICIDTPLDNDGSLSCKQMSFVQTSTEIGRTVILRPLSRLANGQIREQNLMHSNNIAFGYCHINQQNEIDTFLKEGYTVIVKNINQQKDFYGTRTLKSGVLEYHRENSVLIEGPYHSTGALSEAQLDFMQTMGEEGKVVIIKPLPIFDNGQIKEFEFMSSSVNPLFGYTYTAQQKNINLELQKGYTVVVNQ